jgi:hypothetical protein
VRPHASRRSLPLPAPAQAATQVLALEHGRLAFAGDPQDYAQWKGERTPPLRSAAALAARLEAG